MVIFFLSNGILGRKMVCQGVTEKESGVFAACLSEPRIIEKMDVKCQLMLGLRAYTPP